MNIEVFGIEDGHYLAQVVLVDHERRSRSCWKRNDVSFSIEPRRDGSNRSAALQRNLRRYQQEAYNREIEEKFLIQPTSIKDFAYVTLLWSDDFVDNTVVWANSLMATGSTFRRICMIARGRVLMSKVNLLARCCCEVFITDPIHAPVSSPGALNQYALVLTKFRIFQLDRKGLRKVVVMDADTLVLQNIDELFWLPSPSVTVDKDTLMGRSSKPKMSAGIMVLEPDSQKFDKIMERSGEILQAQKEAFFLEQDVLNAFFHQTYNILPLTYNLYPELLDFMPFLHNTQDEGVNSSMWPTLALPLDNGIKVVHLWHLFNPFQIIKHQGAHSLQVNAKRVHKQMWRWYTIFWRLHQEGLQRGAPNDYAKWCERCLDVAKALGPQREKFVPVAGGERCQHIEGLAW